MKQLEITAIANYVHVVAPVRYPGESKAYYRLDVLIPKQDASTLYDLNEHIRSHAPKCDAFDLLKDGDLLKEHTLYKGCYYFTAKRSESMREPPQVVGTPRDGATCTLTLTPLRHVGRTGPGITYRLDRIIFQ